MLEVKVEKELPDFTLDLDFSFQNGILILFGPSGAGKTTLLQCIAGLQNPDGGLIKLNGEVFYSAQERINIATRKRKIGYVFQEYALFPHMSVKDNVVYGMPKEAKSSQKSGLTMLAVLEKLNISNLQGRYPRQLSGGEKQRVALARALIAQPELLLLDEPLSALDENIRQRLQQELMEIQREWQIPFIMVTHNKEEAVKLGDNIIYLNQGKRVTS